MSRRNAICPLTLPALVACNASTLNHIISTVGIVYATGKLLENFAIVKLKFCNEVCADARERAVLPEWRDRTRS